MNSVLTVKEGKTAKILIMILLAVLLLISSSVENKSPPFFKLDNWKEIVLFILLSDLFIYKDGSSGP